MAASPYNGCFWLVAGLVATAAASVHAQTVWELTPYQVRVAVVVPKGAQLQDVPPGLAQVLTGRLEGLVGAAWRVNVGPGADDESNVWQLPEGGHDPWKLPESWRKAKYDKVLLLRVDSQIDGWRVGAREWDAATCRLGPEVVRSVPQPARLRDLAIGVLFEAFRPLARIERVEAGEKGQYAVLRVRAGALPARDPDLQWVHPSQVFCPVLRRDDREGQLRRNDDGEAVLPQPAPWTFLVAREIRNADVRCRIESGLTAPMLISRRGRIESFALAVMPQNRITRLTVLDRQEPHNPIPGYDVFLQQPGTQTTRFLGRTGQDGGIDIRPQTERARPASSPESQEGIPSDIEQSSPAAPAIATILVRSGKQSLARLPLVAGFAPELTAYLPDDVKRLEAEAFIQALQEQLVDLVTQRRVLLEQAQSQMDAGRFDAAKEIIRQIEQLPDRETLRRRLTTRQSQLRSSDPHIQRQIETLFGDTEKLLNRHLDPAPVAALSQAISKHVGGVSGP